MRSDEIVDRAAAAVRAARRVTVLTGAGISTDSGIPDFRGPEGVWTRDPAAERASTIEHFLADPAIRRRAWQRRIALADLAPRPNDGHFALVSLELRGQLVGLVTQNIDGLHHDAGHEPSIVHEVHGTGRLSQCWTCDDRRPIGEFLDRVRAGEEDPSCSLCGGIVKPAVVFFGEQLPAGPLEAAMTAAASCDVFLAVGTTLGVYPVARTLSVARRAGATVVIVNGGPTERDDEADLVARGPIGELLPRICG
ncbi:MAG: SIR2 family NAD-dependent protein deacylase [Ilumatobacteraceae bacterium]